MVVFKQKMMKQKWNQHREAIRADSLKDNQDWQSLSYIHPKKEEIQINKTRDENGDIIIDTNKIQKNHQAVLEILYLNKLENLKPINAFLNANEHQIKPMQDK